MARPQETISEDRRTARHREIRWAPEGVEIPEDSIAACLRHWI